MKAIVVTNPLKGFGLDLVSDLSRFGYLVIGISSDADESENVKKTVQHRFKQANIETFVGSFNSIKEIRQVILNIKLILTNYNLDGIYAYIGNHQTFMSEYKTNSDDIEVQFFQNYLSNFIMCYLLLPYLQKEKGSKILLPTVSISENTIFRFEDLFETKDYNGAESFRKTKMANMLMAAEFNNRFNVGDTPVQSLLYQEKLVTNIEELYEDAPVKGIKKLFDKGDRTLKVYKGIEGILNISEFKEGEVLFRYSKPERLPRIYFNNNLSKKLFEFSEKLGRLKY